MSDDIFEKLAEATRPAREAVDAMARRAGFTDANDPGVEFAVEHAEWKQLRSTLESRLGAERRKRVAAEEQLRQAHAQINYRKRLDKKESSKSRSQLNAENDYLRKELAETLKIVARCNAVYQANVENFSPVRPGEYILQRLYMALNYFKEDNPGTSRPPEAAGPGEILVVEDSRQMKTKFTGSYTGEEAGL